MAGIESSSQKVLIGQPESDRLSHNVKMTTRGGKRDPDSQQ
jgi:hypothetical protein